VQVIVQPSAVISHLQAAMVMEQVIIGMPFIIMQQDIMPPCIMVIMFCIIEHCILSSHIHMIFMPPSHLVMVILQRGIIIMFMGIIPPIPGIMPAIVPMFISFIRPVIIVVIFNSSKIKFHSMCDTHRACPLIPL
jgi:hypothetical protein